MQIGAHFRWLTSERCGFQLQPDGTTNAKDSLLHFHVCLVDGFLFGTRAITPLATDCLLVFQVNCKQFRFGNKRLKLAKSVACMFFFEGLTNPHKITYMATVKCANAFLIETLNGTCMRTAPQTAAPYASIKGVLWISEMLCRMHFDGCERGKNTCIYHETSTSTQLNTECQLNRGKMCGVQNVRRPK